MEAGRGRRICARMLRIAVLASVSLFSVAFTLLAGGYALADPGWPAGCVIVAAWVTPFGTLVAIQILRP